MQEPYRAANCSTALKRNGSNFVEWLTCLNRVLCVAFNSETSIDDSPSPLNDLLPEENRAIFHFINASIPHEFALWIRINPSQTTARAFFDAIKTRCFPGNCLKKLHVVCEMLTMLVENGSGSPWPNNVLVLSLCRTFAILKKLGVEADELKGLLAQAACHTPATLNQVAFGQLVMAAILEKGDNKLTFTFVGQVIINASTKCDDGIQQGSPFVYCVTDLPLFNCPESPNQKVPWRQAADIRRPPEHLVNKFGAACFHCG
ncbi:hypothetical protein O181_061724 [Austropuccinia psidii MF-1]|uniref:Uncharacterized protein n=1 Tax=Austropuccinia psidii MF-1 TaxID=1389203 RepID=A0A9Q3I0U7_9BASI|nr:hypothetical protein [Austropuccinia psidii MF-1]